VAGKTKTTIQEEENTAAIEAEPGRKNAR